MSLVVIVGIAVGLAMDAFSVAVASGVRLGRVSRRQVFRVAFHFGLFQAFMPVLGWAAGQSVGPYIRAWDHWLAFALLSGVGVKAVLDALWRSGEEEARRPDPTRGWRLVALSVATSIDALAVGLSFAFLEVRIWYPCVVIGLVTAALTAIGMIFGARLGVRFGRGTEVLGGLVLMAIGLKIVLEHTLGL